MTPLLRPLVLWSAACAVAAFGAASVASYRPDGLTDRAMAMSSLKRAVGSLNDESLDASRRVTAYGEGLDATAAILRRALCANPLDTASIERFAMVQWESGVLGGGPDVDAVSALTGIAADRAPHVPEIQADLGELFYKMGHADKAAPFMNRAVSLSPSITNRVVGMMAAAGIEPMDILSALPASPTVLIAAKELFLGSGQGVDYLDAVEPQLASATRQLLSTYGEACLQLQVPQRLLDRIVALPPTSDLSIRSERLAQVAHAWLALNDPNRALSFAKEAAGAAPGDPRHVEFYGEVALACGFGAEAELSFRRTLELLLVEGVTPRQRARLYDALGRSLEAQGRADLAYDAFRRAVAIDPSAKHAIARLQAYEHRSPDTVR